MPEGWASASLQAITTNFDGRRVPLRAADRKLRQGAYPYYGASGIIDYIDKPLFNGDFLLVAEDGANLLSRSTPIAFQAQGEFWVNNHAHVLQTRGDLLLSYLEQFLNHLDLQNFVTGTAQPKLTQAALNRIQVMVPPLEEQHRILAMLERILEKADSARNKLERVPRTMKRFRQAVLAAACTGRLTADWRAKNPSAENVDAVLRSLGVEPLSGGGPDEEIPEGWRWVRFGDVLAELKNGLSTKPNQTPPGTPILRINAVRPCEVFFSDLRYLECSEAQRTEFALRDGDLLFTRYNGSIDLLGVCGIVRGIGGRALVYPDKLMRVRFPSSVVLPDYCEQYFSSPAARDRMIAKSKSSAGQNGVSGSDVKAQPLALPPVEEQREIVSRVSAFLTLADSIEQRAKSALQRVETLTQSVLAKAFRGELVPTEAELARREGRGYEHASELLARLKSLAKGETKRARGRRSSPRASTPEGDMLDFMEG
nr:restriction endonuclease subunit S [Paludisphaera mucosa]